MAESNKNAVAIQYEFDESGEIEPEATTDTELTHYGAEVDSRRVEPRTERSKASEFGIDDRENIDERDRTSRSSTEQRTLFADVDEDQVNLFGEKASGKPLFGVDSPEKD